MAYLRMVLILKRLYVRIERVGLPLLASSAREIVTSSAMLIVCRSGYDLISVCVIVCMARFTINAPSVGLLVTCDPFV
jgi:hypothetical protein